MDLSRPFSPSPLTAHPAGRHRTRGVLYGRASARLSPVLSTLSGSTNKPPRLTVGAVNVRSGKMQYFDNRNNPVTLDHVLASGALPPVCRRQDRRRYLLGWQDLLQHTDRGGVRRQSAPRLGGVRRQSVPIPERNQTGLQVLGRQSTFNLPAATTVTSPARSTSINSATSCASWSAFPEEKRTSRR